ncbi:MAG: RHS repeat-associated core domain-containing protein [Phycisphaerae bacterium]|jgi:RHS repeat-associated protein
MNRRVKQVIGGTTDVHVYDGSRDLVVHEGASWWATIYSSDGDKAIATRKSDDSLYYFARDRLGSTRALVNTGGSIVEMYHYSAFGAVYNVDANGVDTAHTPGLTAVLYTGQVWDAESGLHNYRNRYYHPGLGRFLARDPAGYRDGMNLYAYVRNNPLRYTDPDGLTSRSSLLSTSLGGSLTGGFNAYGNTSLSSTRSPQLAQIAADYIQSEREKPLDLYNPGYDQSGPRYAYQAPTTGFGKAMDLGLGVTHSINKAVNGTVSRIGDYYSNPLLAVGDAKNLVQDAAVHVATSYYDGYQSAVKVYQSGGNILEAYAAGYARTSYELAGGRSIDRALSSDTTWREKGDLGMGLGLTYLAAYGGVRSIASAGTRSSVVTHAPNSGLTLNQKINLRGMNEAALEPWKTLGGSRLATNMPDWVFRSDTRDPEVIFAGGFQARGTNLDLSGHLLDNMNPPSAFIATTKSFEFAAGSSDAQYVYAVRPINGLNTNALVWKHSPMEEISIPWHVDAVNIPGVTILGPNGRPAISICNPNYRPR